VPLLRTDNGEIVTQYEMGAAEAIGLLKMDFLGLRNLTVISDAERHVAANRGVAIDLDDPELLGEMDDPPPTRCSGPATPSGCSSSTRPACRRWSAS
jgi:DNA polymerase III subunit alpha